MTYATEKNPQYALLGHGSNGKTSLARVCCFLCQTDGSAGLLTETPSEILRQRKSNVRFQYRWQRCILNIGAARSISLTRPASLISQVKLRRRSASQMPELLSAERRTVSPSVLRRHGNISIIKNSRAPSTFQKLMKKTATTRPFTARCVKNTARPSAR